MRVRENEKDRKVSRLQRKGREQRGNKGRGTDRLREKGEVTGEGER